MRVAQLFRLAKQAGTELRLGPGTQGMMYVEFGYVEGPDPDYWVTNPLRGNYPTREACFMVNLHEIGHAYHNHTQGRPPKGDERHYFDNGVLRSEAQAWEYALDHADGIDLDEVTRKFMAERCIGSYISGARAAGGRPGQRLYNGNRHHVAFTWDDPDDEYVQSIVRRLLGEVDSTFTPATQNSACSKCPYEDNTCQIDGCEYAPQSV